MKKPSLLLRFIALVAMPLLTLLIWHLTFANPENIVDGLMRITMYAMAGLCAFVWLAMSILLYLLKKKVKKSYSGKTLSSRQPRLALFLTEMSAVTGDMKEDCQQVREEEGFANAVVWFCSQWILTVVPRVYKTAVKVVRAGRSVQK